MGIVQHKAQASLWGPYWFQRYIQAGEAWLGVNFWYRSELSTLDAFTNVFKTNWDNYWGMLCTSAGISQLVHFSQLTNT